MSTPTLQQLVLADRIRVALTEADREHARRTMGQSLLHYGAKSEINAIIARALAPIPTALAQDAVDLANRVIREYDYDDGMTVGLMEDARALLEKMEAGK